MSSVAAISASTETRGRLSRERILRAALELVDSNGIESLKMRELAQALGFEAMALYRHVANKDEIVDGILDLVLSETEPARASGDWADAIRKSAISVHEALDRHPWAAGLLVSPAGLRPPRLKLAESLLARLEDAGLSDEACYHAFHIHDAYIIGFSLWEVGHPITGDERAAVAERLAQMSFDDYRKLAKHRDQHLTDGPHHDVSAFEVGLDLLLDGLVRR
jgi:AcrR family transcriptional regulator